MKTYTLHREQWISQPRQTVFNFFSQPENLECITPPWLNFRILTPGVEMQRGSIIEYKLRIRGLPVRWRTVIEEWNPPLHFTDVQLKGPYKLWRHTHRFAESGGGTAMEDTVVYALPFGPIGQIVHRLQVARDVNRVFEYRNQHIEQAISEWLKA